MSIFLSGNSLQENEQASDFKIFKILYGTLDSHINIFLSIMYNAIVVNLNINRNAVYVGAKIFLFTIFLVIFLFYLKLFPLLH